MGIVKTTHFSGATSSLLSAWNTIQLDAFIIPPSTSLVEVQINATYSLSLYQAPATSLKCSYPPNVLFRPTLEILNVPDVPLKIVLNPLGVAGAASMVGSAPYTVSYTVCVPVPKSLATGRQTLQLQIVPEVLGSSSTQHWQFTDIRETLTAF